MTPSGPDPQAAPGFRPQTPWSPLAALIATLLLLLFSVAVTILCTGLVLLAMEGGDGLFDPDDLDRASDQDILHAGFIALLVAQALTVVIVWFLASRREGEPSEVLLLGAPRRPLTLGLSAIGFAIGAAALVYGLYIVWPYDITDSVRNFILMAQSPQWPIIIAVMTLGAAFSEELVFRGFLLSALARSPLGPPGAAVVTSALWAVIHWGYAWQALASIFAMGLALAALVWRTGSIWHAIAAHATYNACAFAYYRWFVTL